MPCWAWNRAPAGTKRRYFELIRAGVSSQAASQPHSTPSHATMGPTDTTMIRNDR